MWHGHRQWWMDGYTEKSVWHSLLQNMAGVQGTSGLVTITYTPCLAPESIVWELISSTTKEKVDMPSTHRLLLAMKVQSIVCQFLITVVTAGDSLSIHDGIMFSTIDSENDAHLSIKCAALVHGIWWYNACVGSSLNSLYITQNSTSRESIRWNTWASAYLHFTKTEMKIKRNLP